MGVGCGVVSPASCRQCVIRSRHGPDHQHCLPSPTVNPVGLLTTPSASASSWRYKLITRATGADASARRGNSAAAVSWGGTGLSVRGRLVLAEGLRGAACIAGHKTGQCGVIYSFLSAQSASDGLNACRFGGFMVQAPTFPPCAEASRAAAIAAHCCSVKRSARGPPRSGTLRLRAACSVGSVDRSSSAYATHTSVTCIHRHVLGGAGEPAGVCERSMLQCRRAEPLIQQGWLRSRPALLSRAGSLAVRHAWGAAAPPPRAAAGVPHSAPGTAARAGVLGTSTRGCHGSQGGR